MKTRLILIAAFLLATTAFAETPEAEREPCCDPVVNARVKRDIS